MPGRSGFLRAPLQPGPWPPGSGSPPSSPGRTTHRIPPLYRRKGEPSEREGLTAEERREQRREKLREDTRKVEMAAAQAELAIERRRVPVATVAETVATVGSEDAQLEQAKVAAEINEAILAEEQAHDFEGQILTGEVMVAQQRLRDLESSLAEHARTTLASLTPAERDALPAISDGEAHGLHEPGTSTLVALRREDTGEGGGGGGKEDSSGPSAGGSSFGLMLGSSGGDAALVITGVAPGSAAAACHPLLAPMDRVVAINGVRVDATSFRTEDEALEALLPAAQGTVLVLELEREATRREREELLLAIERAVEQATAFQDREARISETQATRAAGQTFATLQRNVPGEPYGLGVGYVGDSIVITSLTPGSPADRCGLLSLMDRILAINGISVDRNTPYLSDLLPTDEASAVIDFDFDAGRVRSFEADWPMRATLTTLSQSQWDQNESDVPTRPELPPEKPVATVEVAQDVGESSNGPTSQLAADDNLDGSRRVGQPSPEQQQQTEHETEGVEKVPGALYDAYGNLILYEQSSWQPTTYGSFDSYGHLTQNERTG